MTGGWSEAFLRRGHDVLRIENNPYFRDVPNTRIADVMDPIDRNFDVILASPPCQAFSLASVRHHFLATSRCDRCNGFVTRLGGEKWSTCCSRQKVTQPATRTPKSEFAKESLGLLQRTLDIVANVHPVYWWMENPRATMQHFVPPQVGGRKVEKTTVWYCRYGDVSAKPTHLFGSWPSTWIPRPECSNGNPDCDHQRASRGAKTGTQGKRGAAKRAIVPYELSLEVCLSVEEASA